MNSRTISLSTLGCVLILFFIAGCNGIPAAPEATDAPSAVPPTAIPSITVAPSTAAAPTPVAEHRIGVRVVEDVGEFYDRVSGEKFVPRGNNYVRVAEQRAMSGEMMTYHSTFNVGLYDPLLAEDALRRMHEDGYNVVRVFVHGNCKTGCIGDPVRGLSEAYMANFVDFLRKAEANEIYVIVTMDAEPGTKFYIDLLDTTWSEDFGGTNSSILRGGGILAGKTFWRDFISELLAQNAPLEAILAYQPRNELFFETNAPPFTLTSGTVSTANGKSYDMASDAERQAMMDEGLVFWIDAMRSEILKVDPTALVTIGFFWPQEPHPARIGEPRAIETRPAIWESSADFIDLHAYPGWELSLSQYVDNFGMAGMEEKPIIMGEFGTTRSAVSSTGGAAYMLQNWQVKSCDYGFDGWLFWTWDSDEQGDFYNALSGQGQINDALAPIQRPDPCQ